MAINGMGYVTARKQPYRKWKLFYVGTRNEVYPHELFNSAAEARMYHKVQLVKRERGQPYREAA